MLRPKPSGIEPNHNLGNPPPEELVETPGNIDIQQELNCLEQIIFAGFHIPLTRRTLVDEEKLLEQLDYIRQALPEAFEEAMAILQQKEEIFLEAEEYGQQIVDAAQAKRAQILDESDIIRQAQQEADQLRQQAQQECEAMVQDTLEEIDRRRRACQQELEEMRRQVMAESQLIQQGADEYADSVLAEIEQKLQEMLRVIRNGRQQLQPSDSIPDRSSQSSHKKK